VTPGSPAALEALLDYLKRHRGFDFTGYKRASLERRIKRRMDAVGAPSYVDYLDFLEVHPDEFPALFNTILINVTDFFRDRDAWEYLREEIVPEMLAGKGPDDPIRVWSAGCASGQEPYSVAMILADVMGAEEYVRRVKIYATDVDEEALDTARQAVYAGKEVAEIPASLRERYFTGDGHRFAFSKDLRRTIIFGRNDLVQDAPISRVDLLLCRNTLMYFNAETQGQILRRMHFALNPDGCLFLGKSEMLLQRTDSFTPVNLARRVFRKVPGAPGARPTAGDREEAGAAGSRGEALVEGTLDSAPVAQVAVAADGALVLANRAARALLNLSSADLGRRVRELELSYRPVELLGHLEEVLGTGRGVTVPQATLVTPSGDHRLLEVHVTAVRGEDGIVGAAVAFADLTGQRSMQDELERAKHELATAYEELQSTVEELETTNEELQSTNEELETTNEELQSTNEELETMNEELQSTNEELETINDEFRQRTVQLDENNAIMETVLTTTGVAVLVTDGTQRVQVWNNHAEELWGVRSHEALGQHVLSLDIGLPLDDLKQPLRAALTGEPQYRSVVAARDRRGRVFGCRVTALPLELPGGRTGGVIVLMERATDDQAAPSVA
jgi:two-component system, chemotaxis family, CheB/CheR fusion protein